MLALVSYFLARRSLSGGGGFGSFLILTVFLYALAFQFSEWRRVRSSLFALALLFGAVLHAAPALVTPFVAAVSVGVLGILGYAVALLQSDPRRLAVRVFGIATTFLASFALFSLPLVAGESAFFGSGAAGVVVAFAGFAVVVALIVRDEARSWGALRVGKGKLLGAALGLGAAELAAFIGLLPLGPVRAAALTTLLLLLIREGLGEAYHGGLQRTLVFQGLIVFFVLGVLLFASTSWTL
ncbi:MAG: hypothetical protein Q8P88_02640 [Candidatus Jorgensenbacteria bacterium]|nr:hypothetical protein [Candidatus Jorgensenbacteria bacterium]